MINKYILISGKAGVGKTTFANMLVDHITDLGVFSKVEPFAKGVKVVAYSMGWNKEKDSKGRKLLQAIGIAGRDYDINTWVKYMINSLPVYMSEDDVVVCDDWRFLSEGRYLEDQGYKVYRIRISAPEREILKGTPEYNDISETSLPDEINPLFYDAFIKNTEDITLEELNLIAEEIAIEFVRYFLKEEIEK